MKGSFDTAEQAAAVIQADRASRLTVAGWPRPRAPWRHGKRLPVPWIVPPPEWALMDPRRGRQAIEDRLCQVCGEGFESSETPCVIFLDGKIRDAETLRELHAVPRYSLPPGLAERIVLRARDQAILHERCAKLAVGSCPHLVRAKNGGRLFGFVGPVGSLWIREGGTRFSEVYMRGNCCRPWLIPEATG